MAVKVEPRSAMATIGMMPRRITMYGKPRVRIRSINRLKTKAASR
jgi:hypothetical protein